ncbi:MAG: hypothetical protein WD801_08195 [Gemmatimonadaceae bacterium]
MTRPVQIALVLVALAAVSSPAALRGQGTLSTQGLGFPPGQLSTPSRMMGGATGEADALSALNPAAISMLSTAVLMFQAEPEYRQVRLGALRQRTSVARFPLFFGAIPLGSRWTAAVSASTLLDRTWATTTRDTQFVAADTLASTMTRRSDGSIADVRLAASYAAASWLRFGVSGHRLSGRAVLESVRAFDDTTLFAADTLQSTIGFGGAALSVGAQAFWPRVAAIGLTYRRGGTLRSYSGDTEVDAASAPDHMGLSVVYLGIAGSQIAVRVARDSWSRMRALGDNLIIHEGFDIGIGSDTRGPSLGGAPISVRAGARWRTLPFSASGAAVREQSFSGGFGVPMALGRVELNLGGIYSIRSASGGASEHAWTVATGFLIRP